MKRKMLTACAVVALMLSITPTSPAFQRHPHIQSAIDSLVAARDELKAAPSDFGGHRVAALRAIDEAIAQLRICNQY